MTKNELVIMIANRNSKKICRELLDYIGICAEDEEFMQLCTDEGITVTAEMSDEIKHGGITIEQEYTLIARAQRGDQKALNIIVETFADLPRIIVRGKNTYFEKRIPFDKIDDYIQECRLSLWESVKKFDLYNGVRFSTYAGLKIEKRILETLYKDNFIDFPRHLAADIAKVRKLVKRYQVEHGEEPSDEYILTQIPRQDNGYKMSIEKIQEIRSYSNWRRTDLDVFVAEILAEESSWQKETGERLENTFQYVDPELEILRNCQTDILYKAIKMLDTTEKQVVALYYGVGCSTTHTYADIASRIGISQYFVKKILRGALDKLKSYLDECEYEV